MPDELWTEVCDIVQETGSRPFPRKRNAKKQNGCLGRPSNSCEKKRGESKGEKTLMLGRLKAGEGDDRG